MRLDQLRYLETAIRLGSLRRAAHALGVTQPALTQQVRRLEEEFDVVLLIRHSTGVQATEEAKRLMPYLHKVLQAENALRQETSAISGMRVGHLRLATVPGGSRMFVPQAVRSFHQQFPGIGFEAVEGGSGRVRDIVLAGASDLGVVARWVDYPPDRRLSTIDLLEGTCCIRVPPAHRLADRQRLTIDDVVNEEFVVLEQGQLLRGMFDHIASQVPVTVVYETSHSDSARRTVEAGVGISLEAKFALGAVSSKSVLIPIELPYTRLAMALIRRRDEQPPPAILAFTRIVEHEIEFLVQQRRNR